MTAGRPDLYAPIHKALRNFMADTLGAVGRMDATDPAECAATLTQVQALLAACAQHAQIEDEFIHPALQARRPGATGACDAEHARQRIVLQDLGRLTDAVGRAAGAQRAAAAQELYRRLALFIGENLAHMHEEETVNSALLWAACSDAELAAVHDRIVASIDAPRLARLMRWLAPSLTPAERGGLFGRLQAKVPAEVFEQLLEAARPHLAPRDWNKLTGDIAAAPLAA